MGFFDSFPHIYLAPDNVGGIPNGAGPPSAEVAQLGKAISQSSEAQAAQMITAFENGLHPIEEAEKETNRLLQQYLKTQEDDAAQLLKALGVQTDSLTGLVGGMEANKGLGGSDNPVQTQLMNNEAKNLAVAPKEKPTVQDMLKLSVENSMGFLLLYQELLQIKTLLQGQAAANDTSKKSSGKGIGDIFKGLLEGAAGIALLAVGLMVFAGALLIFGQMGLAQWMNALAGMTAFALFVLGAIEVAKLVKDHVKDFVEFTVGVLLLTAGFLVFGFALQEAAKVGLLAFAALPSLVLFGAFVLGSVAIANMMSANMAEFIMFAAASAILVGAFAIFSLSLILAAESSKYVVAALPTLALFAAFVLGVVGIALLLGEAEPALIAFSASVLIMIAGFALFGLTLILFSKIGGDIPPAMANLALAMQLLVGLSPFFIQIGLLSPLIALASVALAALSISLLLWTAAVAVMSLISPEMTTKASAMVNTSVDLITNHLMGMFVALGLLSPIIAPGSAALLLLSVGMLAWSGVLAIMASLNPKMPEAAQAIDQSNQIIKSIGDFAGGLILQLPALAIFGTAIGVLSVGLDMFADVLKKIASIQKEGTLASAQAALEGIINWIAVPSKDGKSLLNLLDTFSGGPFSFLTGGSVFDKLKAFGEALKPFSESFINLAKAIELVGKVGSPANLKAATTALGSIVGWLIGKDPVSGQEVKGSIVALVQTMDGGKIEDLKKFGLALDPLAESMMKLSDVMGKLKSVGDQTTSAKAAVNAILGLADGASQITQKQGAQSGLDKLVSSLTAISHLNLHSVFEPLLDVLNKNNDLDKMATTLERIVRAVNIAPNRGLSDSVGSLLNGGSQGKLSGGTAGSAPQVAIQHNPDVDQAVVGMYTLLQKWDEQMSASQPGQTPTVNPAIILQQTAPARAAAGKGKGF